MSYGREAPFFSENEFSEVFSGIKSILKDKKPHSNAELVTLIVYCIQRWIFNGTKLKKFIKEDDDLHAVCVFAAIIQFFAITNKIEGCHIDDFIFEYGVGNYAETEYEDKARGKMAKVIVTSAKELRALRRRLEKCRDVSASAEIVNNEYDLDRLRTVYKKLDKRLNQGTKLTKKEKLALERRIKNDIEFYETNSHICSGENIFDQYDLEYCYFRDRRRENRKRNLEDFAGLNSKDSFAHKQRNKKGRYESDIKKCYLSAAYCAHCAGYMHTRIKKDGERAVYISNLGIDEDACNAYNSLIMLHNSYDRKDLKLKKGELSEETFRNSINSRNVKFTGFGKLYDFFLRTVNSELFNEYVGFGSYRVECDYWFYTILFLMEQLSKCKSEKDKYRLAFNYAFVKLIPFHKVRLQLVNDSDSLQNNFYKCVYVGSYLKKISDYSAMVIDALLDEKKWFDESWLGVFQKMTNEQYAKALFDRDSTELDYGNGNEQDFEIILAAWNEYYALMDCNPPINTKAHKYLKEYIVDSAVVGSASEVDDVNLYGYYRHQIDLLVMKEYVGFR